MAVTVTLEVTEVEILLLLARTEAARGKEKARNGVESWQRYVCDIDVLSDKLATARNKAVFNPEGKE